MTQALSEWATDGCLHSLPIPESRVGTAKSNPWSQTESGYLISRSSSEVLGNRNAQGHHTVAMEA